MPRSRREFLTRAGLFAAGASLSAPALALIYDGARTCAAAVSDMTDGNFAITVQPSGAIGPAIDALDAVADGKADCAHTVLSYSWTRNPAYLFASGAPFGDERPA